METNSNRIKENHTIAADILDDLASRFIINIPDSDRSNFVRICFQIELAHWFYLDFYCTGEENRALVPCGIKQFASHIFNHIPFLSLHVNNLDEILQEWKQYKMSVPTYGAILMTADLKHVLLVQSYWAKSSWGFPKGKVNEHEDPLHCAIREVYEETGYDIANLAEPDAFIEGVLNYQYTRLYLIRNVPIETVFVPRTRKEIKCCEWFSVEHLPTHKTDRVSRNHLGINANSFFMIMPFVKRLKKWINEQANPSTKQKSNVTGIVNNCIDSTDQNDCNATNVFFKNNAVSRRQRHKSMGDLDSSNVVAYNSTSGTSSNQINSETLNGDDANKQNGSKRKLIPSTMNTDAGATNRSSSPMYANFQLQPVPQHMKYYYNQTITTNMNGSANSAALQNQFIKLECSKKKTNNTNQPTDDIFLNLHNPPTLSQLLCNEPSINKWQNMRLNKDVIMYESLKLNLIGK